MKIHRLELAGFGPFRERQVVDFDAYDADGVFLIAGRTGAGKSSILDGVCFALYGSVPRYDGGERRLRSDHCGLEDPTEVRVEFTVGDRRWRVTRAPDYERPAKRGGGTTVEPARVEVAEWGDGAWVGRAARAREAAELLDSVLGVNAQQFQQVILLAQNTFSRFLLASNSERQTLLRTLFGTRRFEQYRDDLDARKREAQRNLDRTSERTRTLLDEADHVIADQAADGDATVGAGTAEDAGAVADAVPGSAAASGDDVAARRESVMRAQRRGSYRAETAALAAQQATNAAVAAAEAHGVATARAQTLAELSRARATMAQLDAQSAQIDAERIRLGRARSAEALRSAVDTAERTAADRLRTQQTCETARSAWDARAPGADPAHTEDRLTGEIAVWEAAAIREESLPGLVTQREEHDTELGRLNAVRQQLAERQARFPADRARLDERLQQSLTAAAPRDSLQREVDQLAGRRAAAERALSLDTAREQARADHAAAVAAAVDASTTVTMLLRRRLDGYAGELASVLVSGEPCAVCGATVHPDPAAPHPDPVTDVDLAAAEAERDQAAAREREASARAGQADVEAASAAEAAGGATTAQLDSLLAEVHDNLVTATAAADECDRLRAARVDLDAQIASATGDDESLRAQIADAAEKRAALVATIEAAQADVDTARGTHETVAERVREAVALRELARAAVAAADVAAESRRADEAAVSDLDDRLRSSPFATAAEASAALLSDEDRDLLEKQVTEHGEAAATTRSRLLELELAAAGIDADRVDVAAARAARESADRARDEAVAAQHAAQHRADALRGLVERLDDAFAAVTDVADHATAVIRLADTVAGRAPNTKKMDLETFVLAAELEEIVAAANLRLADMSSGRYSLHHSDALAARGAASGLGIDVLDGYTGQRRSPQSLSGGEKFLASLALALGLAEVVTARAGGIRLDTLFVDEGFGSLDAETLDLAMRTLDELRAGGRTVGIISHVEALKEQIPAQLTVTAAPGGPSVIAQRAAVA